MTVMDLAGIPLLDTHEPVRPEADRLASGGDILAAFFSQYASTDLMAAASRRWRFWPARPAQPQTWLAADGGLSARPAARWPRLEPGP
jgi:hypothetical protein